MTAPWVPTGMKAGVSIRPWGVSKVPARARSERRSRANEKDLVFRSDNDGSLRRPRRGV